MTEQQTVQEKKITIPANTESTLIETGNVSRDLEVGQNATLKLMTTNTDTVKRTITLKQDARLDWIDVNLQSAKAEHHIVLSQQGANAKYRSILLGKNDEQTESFYCSQSCCTTHRVKPADARSAARQ